MVSFMQQYRTQVSTPPFDDDIVALFIIKIGQVYYMFKLNF